MVKNDNLYKLKQLTEQLSDRDYLLKKKVAVYEYIIKTLIKGIWIIDNNEKTIYADELVTKMLKCSLEDLQNKSIYEFIADMDKKIVRKYINTESEGLKEFKFKTKNGKIVKSKIINLVSTDYLKEDGIKFLLVNNNEE